MWRSSPKSVGNEEVCGGGVGRGGGGGGRGRDGRRGEGDDGGEGLEVDATSLAFNL